MELLFFFLAVHSLLRLVNPVFLSKRLSPLLVGSRSSSSLSQPSCSLYTRFTSPLCTTILLSSLFRRFQPDVPALQPRVHVLSDARGSNVRARDRERSVHAGVGHVRAALFAPNAFMGRASRALLVPPLVAPLTKTSSFDRIAKNWLIENSSYRQTFNILPLYYVPWNQEKSEWNLNASKSGSPWISQESARKLHGCSYLLVEYSRTSPGHKLELGWPFVMLKAVVNRELTESVLIIIRVHW